MICPLKQMAAIIATKGAFEPTPFEGATDKAVMCDGEDCAWHVSEGISRTTVGECSVFELVGYAKDTSDRLEELNNRLEKMDEALCTIAARLNK